MELPDTSLPPLEDLLPVEDGVKQKVGEQVLCNVSSPTRKGGKQLKQYTSKQGNEFFINGCRLAGFSLLE